MRARLHDARLRGDRVVTRVPALRELHVGIALTAKREHNQRVLTECLRQVRVWPSIRKCAELYSEIYHDLRRRGRALSQVDILLAALATHIGAVLVTTDRDFEAVPGIRQESWLRE